MCVTSRFILAAAAMIFAVTAPTPVRAQISAELANKCRTLMIKAHPTALYGKRGSEAAQRAYFQRCISQSGNMPDAADSDKQSQPPKSTGAGN